MKYIVLIIVLLIMQSSLLLAQQTKEEKLQQLKQRDGVKVTEVKKDIIKIEYPNGKTILKNIADYSSELRSAGTSKPPTTYNQPTYSPTFDSTIIDLRTIDTTLYYYKYSFWKEVPIHNGDFDHLRIADVNNNGRPDLYGSRKFFWSDFEPITIYELNAYGNFDFKYQYDSVYLARNIYDVDKDGQEEVLLTLPPIFGPGNQQKFFSKPTETSFATQLNFILNYPSAQLNDIVLGDFDGDQNTDMLFAKSGWFDVHILEYNPFINNFDSVYRFDVNEPPPWNNSGFSVGDFDLDGKTDMVFGTMRGNVFVLENEGDNQYTNSWQGSVESYNAYIHTWSNDIDKNGKPEFWVLADAYYNGIGTTRITIFETDGDNSYQAVGRVDLIGVFSFYAGTMQAVDIDNDGTEEIAICIDDNFLILKFNGSRDHHTYKVYYIKKRETYPTGEWITYYGAIMYDLKQSGDYNILISMSHILYQQTYRHLTKIYKPDSLTVGIEKDLNIPKTTILNQNYPNPFNASTEIKYTLAEDSYVTVKVFDMLGTEVRELVSAQQTAGNYEVNFIANNLSSGVYIYRIVASKNGRVIYTDAKQMILMK